jgi:glycosyltransferase involved in cell wall biosynthesis
MSGLSHDSLKAAYSIAEALIFPSWHEGFGWPIIEAQYCGCPVFTSNRPPMTEVGGDGVAVFDPSDPDSAAAVVLDGLRDREALRGRGFANASRFKVSSMMDQYEIAYRDLTGQAEGS